MYIVGFFYEMWNVDIFCYKEVFGLFVINIGLKDMFCMLLLFDFGECWEYGINIDWVGLMVEVVSGQKLGDYF